LKAIIKAHFPQDRAARVLDLGCGHGAFLHFIQSAGYHQSEGIDRSPEQVAEAERLGVSDVRLGDLIETLRSAQDDSYDVVIAFDVIEHFKKEELLPFIDEVQRVLKPGGRWIIHAPNGESPFAGRMYFWDFTHELAFTRTSIAQLLRASGFTNVRSFEDAPVPHGLKSTARWMLWKGIRSALMFYIAVETGFVDKDAIFSQNFLTVATK
jgi:2-polyprenyl-3-methyl-5-hydroxy-6-metoxy-1,4-benzoquinol methylase